MGHGEHWRCILPDVDNGIAQALGWISQGPAVGQREDPTLQLAGGIVGGTVSVIAWPEAGLRATFIVVRDQQGGRPYLHTAFPAATAGFRHMIRIDSVHEISCGLEARISGTLGDAEVTFFDPLYCLNRDRYRPGALLEVGLAAIAYSLRVVPKGTKLKSVVGDVLLDNAAVLMSACKDKADRSSQSFGDEDAFGLGYIVQPDTFPLPDDYQFCAPVKDVEKSEIDSIPFWKFRATVLRPFDGSQDVDIDIYATREGMKDAVVLGDEISGTLWLQGTLPRRNNE